MRSGPINSIKDILLQIENNLDAVIQGQTTQAIELWQTFTKQHPADIASFIEQLDEENVSQLCMFMRVIDLFDKNESIVNSNPEMADTVKELREKVQRIMDLLTDEQKDYVLEEHKIQSEIVAKEIEKEKKKAAKKKK